MRDQILISALPPTGGIGLKPQHWRDLIEGEVEVGWVEIHAENFMIAGGPAHRALDLIRERVPLSIHGVGLSLGSAEGIDGDHLEALARLVDRHPPHMVSEHLAWNAVQGHALPDLLPIEYDSAMARAVAANIERVQDRLGRAILIENPSRYDPATKDPWAETDFIQTLCATTGCGLLLDVNNIIVSARNLGFDAQTYLARLPLNRVGEIHLAGHDPDPLIDKLVIDTHRGPVPDEVWALYRHAIALSGPVASLIEWDSEPPSAAIMAQEAHKASQILAQALTHAA